MKKIFVLLIIVLGLCGCSSDSLSENGIIGYEDAKKLIDNGAVLVDVRSKEEYDVGHIEGAVLLPVDTIDKESASAVFISSKQTIIVYCRSGARSSEAYKKLTQLGYTEVYDLGSIDNWRE